MKCDAVLLANLHQSVRISLLADHLVTFFGVEHVQLALLADIILILIAIYHISK